MKKVIFLFVAMAAFGIAKAQKSNTSSNPLDVLITQLKKAVQEQNIAKAKACLNTSLQSNIYSDTTETCTRSEFLEGIPADQLWKELARIEAACNGFAFRDDGHTFENTYSEFRSQNGSVFVKAEGLALRRGPGNTEEVIVRLHEGAYVGYERTDALAMKDPKHGYTWIPIQMKVGGLGVVRGYVAQEYIEVESSIEAYQIVVAETPLGLRITEIHQEAITPSFLPSASL